MTIHLAANFTANNARSLIILPPKFSYGCIYVPSYKFHHCNF